MAGKALEDVPQDIRDLFNKGLGATERGNFDYALAFFSTCLETEPALTDARKHFYTSAVKKFRAGKSGRSGMGATIAGLPVLVQASINVQRGAPLKAMTAIESILKDAPLNLRFIMAYCDAADAADMAEVSLHVLATARATFPTDPALLARLGHLCLTFERPAEARECFDIVHRLKPGDAVALRDLKNAMAVQSMDKDGWDAAASGTAGASARKNTKESDLVETEHRAVWSQSDTATLIEDAKAKIESDPSNVNYRRALANLYSTKKMFDEAITTLQETQNLRGNVDPDIDTTLSATMLKKFDHQIAEFTSSGNSAAAAELRIKRNDFFFEDIQKRVNKYPNDLTLRCEYGIALYDRGMLNEAIHQFQLAQRHPRWHVKSLYHMGLCLKAKRQYDMALDQFQKAASELISMDNTKKDIFYEMGLIKEAMDDTAGALVFFKEIYQVDIAYKDVAQKVEQGYSRK